MMLDIVLADIECELRRLLKHVARRIDRAMGYTRGSVGHRHVAGRRSRLIFSDTPGNFSPTEKQ